MIKYMLIFLFLPLISAMDVYSIPGGLDDFLKMIRHPGDKDLDEMSMCMRFVRLDKGVFHRLKYCHFKSPTCFFNACRFYSTQLPKGGIGNMKILASVMSGEGNGIRDEFFTLYMQAEEAELDEFGRGMGTYLMATRGFSLLKSVFTEI